MPPVSVEIFIVPSSFELDMSRIEPISMSSSFSFQSTLSVLTSARFTQSTTLPALFPMMPPVMLSPVTFPSEEQP